MISATNQTNNNQLLHQYFLHYNQTTHNLPNKNELKGETRKLVDRIVALQKAPVIEHYTKPILFKNKNTINLIHSTLTPHLNKTPIPKNLNPQKTKTFNNQLTNKINLKILTPNLTIINNPTTHKNTNKTLINNYKINNKNITNQHIKIVKNNMLKTLLTSHTPSTKNQTSNNHTQQISKNNNTFHNTTTNLFVSGKNTVPRKALEQRLINTTQNKNLKYGVVIRQFDDTTITSTPEFSHRELYAMIKSTNPHLPPPTLLAYKIYPNNKKKLIHNIQLTKIPIHT